jgi:hypothetical protein
VEIKQTKQGINETKSWFFEKRNKIGKLQPNEQKETGKRPKLIKIEMKKGILQQIPMKFRVLQGNILKIYILIIWKI